MVSEITFKLNNFNEPEILEGVTANAKQLIRLLFLEKGIHRSAPTMGIDINKFRFMTMDEDSLATLKSEILTQCQTYLPELMVTEVDVMRTGQSSISIGFRLSQNTDIIIQLGQTVGDTQFTIVSN